MSKYKILIGSVDMNDQSLGMTDSNGKNIKYMKGDLLKAFNEAGNNGCSTFEQAMSWQREQLEAGKKVTLKFVNIG